MYTQRLIRVPELHEQNRQLADETASFERFGIGEDLL